LTPVNQKNPMAASRHRAAAVHYPRYPSVRRTSHDNHDATFQLTTVQPGDGAVPGRYKVTITPPPAPEAGERGQKPRRFKPALDQRYLSLEQTDLVATVGVESNVIQLKVKRAGSAKP